MLTKEKILEVLKGIRDPEIGENIVDLNMVRGINVGVGGVVDLEIALTVPECPLTATIRRDVNTALTGLGASSVNIKFTSMSESERGADSEGSGDQAHKDAESSWQSTSGCDGGRPHKQAEQGPHTQHCRGGFR